MKAASFSVRLILAAGVLLSAAAQAQSSRPVALKRFDPILLAQGKQLAGKADLKSTYHQFSYLFASDADKKEFDADPAAHAVQFDGACLHMATMKGDPNLFIVHGGKIYLAGSQACLDSIGSDIDGHIKATEEALHQTKVVEVMMFSGVEDIDFAGPVEVLSGTGYKIVTVAATTDPIKTVAGLVITPDYSFADCPKADVIVLPGGGVPKVDQTDPRVQWVTKMAKDTPHVLSVCNGAFWLAYAGLLDGKEATTTFGNIPRLAKYEKIHVVGEKRFTDNGQIITSAGLSAGIDGALHLVEKMEGADTARLVASNIEYNWQPDGGFSRGAMADRHLLWVRQAGIKGVTRGSILKQDGDKDNWSVTWEVDLQGITASDLRDQFEKGAVAQKWTIAGKEGDNTSYQFTDSEGKPWKVQVTTTSKEASKADLVVEIHRA